MRIILYQICVANLDLCNKHGAGCEIRRMIEPVRRYLRPGLFQVQSSLGFCQESRAFVVTAGGLKYKVYIYFGKVKLQHQS